MANGSSQPRRDFRQEATDLIIEMLEKGTSPWQQPFDKSKAQQLAMPRNATTDRSYTGGNALFLMAVALKKGYDDPRWMTFRQAQEKGWQVRRGEKASTVEFWQFDKVEKVRDPVSGLEVQERTRRDQPLQRLYAIFNAKQLHGIAAYSDTQRAVWQTLDAAERALQQSGALIRTSGASAYYLPVKDEIVLPPRSTFPDQTAYYGTALHELAHWTGHASRLNRDGITGGHAFGSEAYAREELRAEIASVFLQAELGVRHDIHRHASYVDSWIAVLKKDKHEVFRAAKEAGEAADFVMALTRHRELDDGLATQLGDRAVGNVVTRFGRLAGTIIDSAEGPSLMAAALHRELRQIANAELAYPEDRTRFLETFADSPSTANDAEKVAGLERALQTLDLLENLPAHAVLAHANAAEQRVVDLSSINGVAFIDKRTGNLVIATAAQPGAGVGKDFSSDDLAGGTALDRSGPHLVAFDLADSDAAQHLRTTLQQAETTPDEMAQVLALLTSPAVARVDCDASFAAIATEAHRHLGSSARTYPAQVAEGLYSGPIIAESDHHVLQQVSKATTIAHLKSAFATSPVVDQSNPVKIPYDSGRASIAPLGPQRGPIKDRGLGR